MEILNIGAVKLALALIVAIGIIFYNLWKKG